MKRSSKRLGLTKHTLRTLVGADALRRAQGGNELGIDVDVFGDECTKQEWFCTAATYRRTCA